jgi:formate dehydrogenase iron-sulfur subunit
MRDQAVTERKGLLIDTTRCVGCGACYEACKKRNNLPKTATSFLQDKLSARTFSVVQQLNGRYVRRLCMHCEVPTCVSVCPVGAFEKTDQGPVIYRSERCIGCRYCMQACPFEIPKYEWERILPFVRKCDLCADRLTRGEPTACSVACPTGATLFGSRRGLLAEAQRRIDAQSGRYDGHIFGAEEVGGTSVMVISDLPPGELGLPTNLGKAPLPQLTWAILQKIPSAVACAGVLLGGTWWITKRREEVARAERRRPHSREFFHKETGKK